MADMERVWVAKTSEAAESAALMKQQEVAKKTEAAEGAVVMKRTEEAQKTEAADSAEVMKKLEEAAAKKSEVVESAARRKRNKGKRNIEAEKSKLMMEEIKKKNAEKCHTEEIMDPYAYKARSFKKWWEGTFGGNFYETTSRFIANLESGLESYDSMQIISVKISELTGGLQWPLDVYGLIAVRDSCDHKRNIIFERVRENCQTLTLEDPYLVLTGPMRAVMDFDPVFFEVSLYVRGTDKSDDKELNLLAIKTWGRSSPYPYASILFKRSYTSRLSTIEFNLATIICSVEATISVNVISGPPNGFSGEFVAFNADVQDRVVLHKSGEKEFYLAGDEVHLSRSLISVGVATKLIISVTASDGAGILTSSDSVSLDPLEKGGTSFAQISVAGVCELKVTVVWSPFPEDL